MKEKVKKIKVLKKTSNSGVRFVSISALFIIVMLIAVILLSTLSIIHTAREFASMQGVPVVEKVYDYIDGDKFEKLTKTLKSDAWEEKIQAWMLDVAHTAGCAYLFTMSPVSGTTYQYIIDGSDEKTGELYSPMGTQEDISSWSKAPLKAMKTGELTSSGIIYQDGWGWIASTYKGIKNSNGDIVGFIGCDFDVSFIIKTIQTRIATIAVISVFILVVFSVIIMKLRKLMLQIKASSDIEHRISEQLLGEVQNLAVAAKENSATSQDSAAAVKEIVATMEDTNKLSECISSKSKSVSALAGNTSTFVVDGVVQIEQNVEQLKNIYSANLQTIEGIKNLNDRIESIWDIVSLINNVADQAKIIAFNAELEASTAGEAGKSFRIVANEIRRLSDGIIEGTREIKEKINEIQHSSDELIHVSQAGTEKINVGYETAQSLGEKFASIKDSARQTAESAQDISDIINQQTAASGQILMALKEISGGIENFTVATDNISSASENVRKLSEELNNSSSEKAGGKSAEKASEKTVEKAAEKPAEKKTDK